MLKIKDLIKDANKKTMVIDCRPMKAKAEQTKSVKNANAHSVVRANGLEVVEVVTLHAENGWFTSPNALRCALLDFRAAKNIKHIVVPDFENIDPINKLRLEELACVYDRKIHFYSPPWQCWIVGVSKESAQKVLQLLPVGMLWC